jgi:cytochrome c biogenesis protein CcdA
VTTLHVFTARGAWLSALLGIRRTAAQIAIALLSCSRLTLIVPRLGELLERPLAFLTRRRGGDLGGGFLLGASLGLVFVPCAGPVLAP